jgi:hypothetical protein
MSKRQPDGLINNAVGWGDSESLLITGYSRHIQQIAYVDSLLGKLREQLIESGNYDESLVIIMADHGVAYQRGQSRRNIDEGNVNEILNVPLLLKLPRQAQGEINERVVSSVDILPTILDILDADTQLEFDGSSMYSQQDPLTVIDIPRAGELSTDSILQRTQLDWQIENFGENTPLGKLVPKGPFHELANRSIGDLTIGDSAGLAIASGDFMAFESVDKASGFIPALFSEHIENAGGKKLAVAIALNGKIVTTTNTSEWQGQKNYFSVLLPSDAFVDGRNLGKAYQILGSEGKPTLHAFQGGVLDVSLQLGKTGPDSLIFRGKELVALEQNRSNMNGYSDNVAMENGMIRFAGWAADLADQLPASYILIFRGEQLVWQIVPQVERNAVAEKFGTGLLLSGYSALVPPSALQSKSGDISLIAVSGENRALRLHLRPEVMTFLHATLN